MSDPNSDEEIATDSELEQETAIDDIEEDNEETGSTLEAEGAAGYPSAELEDVDVHSTPVHEQLSPPRSLPEVEGIQEEEEISRHSPFVPEGSDESTPSPPSTSAAAVRVNTRRPPPNYTSLPQSGSSDTGIELEDLGRNHDSVTADIGSSRDAVSTEQDEPKPPPYSVAVALTDGGINRPLETTFGPEITTRSTSIIEEEARHVVGGRDEPPPGYSSIDLQPERRRAEERRQPTDTEEGSARVNTEATCAVAESDVDVEARDATRTETSDCRWGWCPSSVRDRLPQCSCTRRTKRIIIIVSVIFSLLVLFAILFPIQFSYVDYYSFALVRTKSTGKVATDRVYEHGCYVLGANKEFVYLQRTIHPIAFDNVGMFTRDNVDLSIDVKLYYYLNYEDIPQLWLDYAGEHEHVISAAALTVIKNCAPRVSQDEYLLDREDVEKLITDALVEKFEGWGITISHFIYLNLYLPSRVIEKKLKLLLLRTEIEKEHAYQLQREIELGTELLTTSVIYLAREAINNGTVEAAAVKTIAETEKSQHVDIAHANAFNSMMDVLNVTQEEHALSFYYLATLNTMDHYGGVVEYSKRAAYMP